MTKTAPTQPSAALGGLVCCFDDRLAVSGDGGGGTRGTQLATEGDVVEGGEVEAPPPLSFSDVADDVNVVMVGSFCILVLARIVIG
jgi:hypothetical protein